MKKNELIVLQELHKELCDLAEERLSESKAAQISLNRSQVIFFAILI